MFLIQLKAATIKQIVAALKLKLTSRWVHTKHQRYLKEGTLGLVHKNRGKPSPNQWNDDFRDLVIDLLKTDWYDKNAPPLEAIERVAYT